MRRHPLITLKFFVVAASRFAASLAFQSTGHTAQQGVKIGYLRCDVAGSVSFIFGSSRDLTCEFEASDTHKVDAYKGTVKQYGIDIGYQKKGVILWAVLAPTNTLAPGALSGDYVGISADLAAGYGVGANALLGGYQQSVALQPMSIEGIQGLNIAAGVAGITLEAQ